jgi:hypothetical protein
MDMHALGDPESEFRIPESPELLAHGARIRAARRAASVLSVAIVGLMVATSLGGLLVSGLYDESQWAEQALRGGDLVTVALAAPLLLGALVLTRRGSTRARTVWIGVLGYSVYNSAFYAFGTTFNDAFLLHIALLSCSIFALTCAIVSTDLVPIARTFGQVRGARWVGAFLAAMGALQGALWLVVLARNVTSGTLIADVPVDGQHLVFALDLALLVPSLVLAGVLLLRRAPLGYLLGAAMAVMGAVYQVNMLAAGVFQSRADVEGSTAFAPENLGLTVAFAIAALFLLAPRRSAQERSIS